MHIAKTKKHSAEAYTLVETITVLVLSLSFFVFPVLSFRSLEHEQSTQRFFDQLEKRIDLAQQSAIIHQQATRFYYDPIRHSLLFDVPAYSSMEWQVVPIPETLTVERHAMITYAANTGNESSLKAYEFYWVEKQQRIIYQFQLGGGRYIKKVQSS
ncbi:MULTISPECIES: competence type IV pilus minor pilin ComGD [unclassified Enterococcus]|uniref:competence type IV pilus minor pilin ComGD n=1 Tax=unclassified Enterococcus TaxID=2608891 RepID=UPI001A925C5E|nr:MULTISPECIES: competence type IV pilus minor pilin ComGD [unclassified Enterococcus]MBO0462402.1 type II secretion system protein [Enterococcus sp. DIV1298c]MBO1300654.1 type II secretion system protein [Enterococcus sp. DIV1271a]